MFLTRRVIKSLVVAVATVPSGCVKPLPEVPRYRPPAVDAPTITHGSDQTWSEARKHDGAIEDLDSLQEPTGDARLDTLLLRVERLRREAERRRDELAREIIDAIPEELDEDRRAVQVAELADLLRTGLSDAEEIEAVSVLDRWIETWFAAGTTALEAGRFEEALKLFNWASHAAADGLHPRRELESIALVRRLVGQEETPSGAGVPLPPRVLAYTLDALHDNHVDRPTWRSLVDGGFAALEQRIRSEAGRAEVLGLQHRFERSVTSTDPPRSTIARALNDLGSGLAEAGRRGRWGPNVDGVRIFLEGMLATTDVRSDVFYGDDAAMFRRMLDGSYIGIGTTLTLTPRGVELDPVAGGPARRAGIATGDVLVSVDGTSVDELGLRGATTRILGERGTEVVLEVRRGSEPDEGTPMRVRIRRDEVERELVHGWRQLGPGPNGRPLWDWVVDPELGIAYVGIREFTEDTDRRFRRAMLEADRELSVTPRFASQVEGLILDLRNNRGGRRDSTERLLDLFISTGSLFETVDGADRTKDRTPASARTTRLRGMPVVVLIDEQSASAAEILAGTLQARADAIVVGERSYGKGSVQAVLPQPDGFLLVTESWFLVPERGGGARLIDRLRTDMDWGVRPDLSSTATDSETLGFLRERSDWSSDLDQDEFDSGNLPTIERTSDRPLLDAVILLRSRLLGTRTASQPGD